MDHLIGRHAQKTKPCGFQNCLSLGISLPLAFVNRAIDFNHELELDAIEIDDKAPHRLLAAKLQPIATTIAQHLPQQLFRSCRILTESGCKTME